MTCSDIKFLTRKPITRVHEYLPGKCIKRVGYLNREQLTEDYKRKALNELGEPVKEAPLDPFIYLNSKTIITFNNKTYDITNIL